MGEGCESQAEAPCIDFLTGKEPVVEAGAPSVIFFLDTSQERHKSAGSLFREPFRCRGLTFGFRQMLTYGFSRVWVRILCLIFLLTPIPPPIRRGDSFLRFLRTSGPFPRRRIDTPKPGVRPEIGARLSCWGCRPLWVSGRYIEITGRA